MIRRNPCTCTFIRHCLSEERPALEREKLGWDQIAASTPNPVRRNEARTQSAILYFVLHSECVTAPVQERSSA